MKVGNLIAHSKLVAGQYITVHDHTNNVDYSSEGIGRYNFGKAQDEVLGLKVNTFEPRPYGLHIWASK